MTSSITKDDFPLYQLLMDSDMEGLEKGFLEHEFTQAAQGSDQNKYSFALVMQQIIREVPTEDITNCTEEAKDKTLASCHELFKALAEHGDLSDDYLQAATDMAAHTEQALTVRKAQPRP